MTLHPLILLRAAKAGVYRRLAPTPGGQKSRWFRVMSAAWRAIRWVYRRSFQRRPEMLLCLDGQAELRGFGSITGWAMSRSSPICRIELWSAGVCLATARPAIRRPDVLAHFPRYRGTATLGFRLAPDPDLLRDGSHAIEVRAIAADGRQAVVKSTLRVLDYTVADDGSLPDHLQGSNREYQIWIQQHEAMEGCSTSQLHGPLISIVVPVFRPNLGHLRAAVESVIRQSYTCWELCLCDDGSAQTDLTVFLRETAASDERIKWTQLATNCGISAATNAALQMARGDFVAFMDQDDLLAPRALAEVAAAIQDREPDVIYTDEDRLDEHGFRVEPFFKPDWSPDLLLSMMYLAHLCVYRRSLLQRIGSCRGEFDGAQDWDLALRATAATDRIVHIPKILYHWRHGGNSAGASFNRICQERGRRAILDALQEKQLLARVTDGPSSCTFHVRYELSQAPLVSILIPTRDNHALLHRCLTSIRCKTRYPHREILVLDNGSRTPDTLRYLAACRERVIRIDRGFNHSQLNNIGARAARGSLLLLLNDDTEVINPDWLEAMVEQATRPDVGAVGAWLLFPDGRTQHAGVVVGLGDIAVPLQSGITRDGLDRGTVRLVRNVSAVTGACLMIRKTLFHQVGGLDEEALPTSFNDVDLCLRLRRAGYRIMQTPLARLYHHESATRTTRDESKYVEVMRQRWSEVLAADPFWNANLPQGAPVERGFAFQWSGSPRDAASDDASLRIA